MQRVILLTLWAASACSPALDARLLQLEPVPHVWLEQGSTLTIAGAGFPRGGQACLWLTGEMMRPGFTSEGISLRVTGRASSAEAVTVVVSERILDEVGGRGTFRGRLRVEFPMAHGEGVVAGAVGNVTLDFLSAVPRPAVSPAGARGDRARVLRAAGLSLGESDEPGLVLVTAVEPGSPAARAGLQLHDRVVSAGGLTLWNLDELSPPEDLPELRLQWTRQGDRTPSEARLVLRGTAPARSTWWVPLALAALVLLTLVPVPTWALACRAAPWRSGRAGASSLGCSDSGALLPRDRRLRWVWRGGMLLAGSVALSAMPLAFGSETAGVHAGWLLLLGLVPGLLCACGSGRTMFKALGTTAVALFAAAAAVGAVGALTGSFGVAAVVLAQGPAPWQWHAFRQPAASLAALALVLIAATPVPVARGLGHVAAWMRLLVVSGLVAALLLGGWRLPGAIGDLDPSVAQLCGMGLFAAKGWVVALLALCLRSSPRWRGHAVLGATGTAALALFVAFACEPLSDSAAQLWASVLLGAGGLLAGLTLAARGRIVPGEPHLPLFL